MLSRLLNFKETMSYLSIGKNTLLELLGSGELKGFKIRGSWRVHEDDFTDYINRLRGVESTDTNKEFGNIRKLNQ